MIRLHITVEGQTEEGFVNSVLVEHFARMDIFVDARCVETGRSRRSGRVHRGGLQSYSKAKKDLLRWIKEDQHPEVFFTTMFDLYRLPTSFPQYDEARKKSDSLSRVRHLEKAFADDISGPRFIPYLQLHEFETLLLSDPSKFGAVFLEYEAAIQTLMKMADGFDSPELIDDGESTAPSKRIVREIPSYQKQKASAGPIIAEKIGLPAMRQKCPHFDSWLTHVETLSAKQR